MMSEVWVSVCGVHETDGECAPVQTDAIGFHSSENGQHRINYEESADGDEKTYVQMTVSRPFTVCGREVRRVDVVKSGVRMRFVPGCRQRVHYRTPYGVIAMDTETHDVTVEERETLLRVRICYDLEMDGRRVSKCTLTAEVTPYGAGESSGA